MRHQPMATGEIQRLEQSIDLPPPELAVSWRTAADLAVQFWERVGADERISSPFRREMRGRADAIRRAIVHTK
jgi:hypothetical protein